MGRSLLKGFRALRFKICGRLGLQTSGRTCRVYVGLALRAWGRHPGIGSRRLALGFYKGSIIVLYSRGLNN